ncbi:hypothetical protein [Streptomyces sp. NPDC048845]|uniref:hypothetical protein n=1 Tax=Streptomyces sp. NPDC048845 TaxID=3155390 RepID=UPI003448BFF3
MVPPPASRPTSPPAVRTRSEPRPNTAFRELRGSLSPGEFAAAVRRAAREIGEQVSCDARYIGRVESGEIRCPNYAYERVFRHMFPGRTLGDMGFSPRESVRGRGARGAPVARAHEAEPPLLAEIHEESDVLRRAFMTGGTAALATASLGPIAADRPRRRAAAADAAAVEDAVRRIRLLDDRHGADGLYRRAAGPLRGAYALLDAGAERQSTNDRLHAGVGELALSVGWLAHDSGRFADARSHYAEALATARVSGDAALEAHAFCNTAFLARDAGRPREAVRAAQAAQRAARRLASHRLLSLLALREAGGWAGLGDRTACQGALLRAHTLFARGPSAADPEWMSFFGEAELEGLESQCWAALGDWARAARHARRAAALQDPHFARNTALFTAELAGDLAREGVVDEAAAAGLRVLGLLGDVESARVRAMLDDTARALLPHRRTAPVAEFLSRVEPPPGTAGA